MENDRTEHSQEYTHYINSPEWKKRRAHLLQAAGYRCQVCRHPKLPSKLQVHHLTYERLGNELSGDLVVVCTECHPKLDRIRQRHTQRRQEEARYNARLDGWARKVYGE